VIGLEHYHQAERLLDVAVAQVHVTFVLAAERYLREGDY
jgi:hypothetical protein